MLPLNKKAAFFVHLHIAWQSLKGKNLPEVIKK